VIGFAQHVNQLLAEDRNDKVAVNKKDDGYRGIWYHTFSRGMTEA
jgi:hypothetical protein